MKTQTKKWLISIGINLAVLTVLLLMFVPAEKTDDFIMKCILSGAMAGETSAHLLYSSIFLGKVLQLAQGLFPGVAWYEVSQYITLFASFTIFTFLMWQPERKKQSLLILLPVLLFFGFETYIKLTFSKTAGVAMGVGIFVLLHGLQKEKRDWPCLITGFFLTILGCLFRQKIVYSVLPIFAGVILLVFWLDWRDHHKFPVRCLKYIAVFLAIFVMALGLKYTGRAVFNHSPDWAAYREYNTYKVELQDYGWPDYNEHINEYTQLGISYNDYLMWTNRDYGDPELFTVDRLAAVCEIKDNESFSEKYLENIKPFFEEYPLAYFDLTMFAPVVLLAVLLLFSDAKHKPYILLWPLAISLLLNYYLFCNGRYGRHHVDIALWFCVSIFLSFFLRNAVIDSKKLACTGALAVVLTFFCVNKDYTYMTTATYTGTKFTLTQDEARAAMDLLTGDKDALYVLSNDEYYGLMRAYGALEAVPAGQLDNIFVLSSYMYPSHRSVLDQRGYTNIYQNLCTDNIYYVTSSGSGNASTILSYIQEHYYSTAYYTKIKSMCGIDIYQFDIGPLSLDISDALPEDETIVADISATSSKECLSVSGYAYKSGTSSFYQRVYLSISQRGGQTDYYCCLQTQNVFMKEDTEGLYSSFSVTADLEQPLRSDSVALILETAGGEYYQIPVTITE